MKTDDPRLERSRKEMAERVNKMNALTLAVLRGHLLAEQAMNGFLEASRVSRKTIHLLDFAQKAEKCNSLSRDQKEDPLWKVLKAANDLRNKIAHTLVTAEIQDKMHNLRSVYLSTLTPQQAQDLVNQPNDYVAQSACVTCAGFLATLEEDARARRQGT